MHWTSRSTRLPRRQALGGLLSAAVAVVGLAGTGPTTISTHRPAGPPWSGRPAASATSVRHAAASSPRRPAAAAGNVRFRLPPRLGRSVAPARLGPGSRGPAVVTSAAGGPPRPASGLRRSGRTLLLDGRPYRFTGVNAYELATAPALNTWCGAAVTDGQLADLFRSLPPHSMVRLDAYQYLAIDQHTGQFDFSGLDRVFSDAAAAGQLLDVVLSSQAGVCDDDHWHDAAWYAGGYRSTVWTDGGRNREPFDAFLEQVVTRYRSSPAVGMWEPVSEPDASACTNHPTYGYQCQTAPCTTRVESSDARLMRGFFDAVGGQIHTLDPGSLVAAGFVGTDNQCGTEFADYRYVGASPGLDVLTYHDYGDNTTTVPATLRQDIGYAGQDQRPIIVEEAGMLAGPTAGTACAMTLGTRANRLAAKAAAGYAVGLSGYLAWNWVPAAPSGCDQGMGPGDPALAALAGALARSSAPV